MARGTGKPNLSKHNLGHVRPQELIEEAKIANDMLIFGFESLRDNRLEEAMDLFFKSAAVSVNVIFTTRVNRIPMPHQVMDDMITVSTRATNGIRLIMKKVISGRIARGRRKSRKRQRRKVGA